MALLPGNERLESGAMTNRLRRFALLNALLLAPAAAAADQPAGPAGDAPAAAPGSPVAAGADAIVVTGDRPPLDRREVTRQARAISRDGDVWHTPLARFEDRACPGVFGLRQDTAELVVGRFRMIAEDLNIPLAPEGQCQPNIIVAFVEDGRASLAEVNRKTRQISEVLSVNESRELLEEPGPVRVFSVVETRTASGMPVPRRRDMVNIPVARQEGGQSLITTTTRQDIVKVVVLFDREAVKGKTVHQLADYAVMRAFARTRDAEGERAPDSILGLFDEGNPAPAEGLTEFDRAFLATLYEGVPHIKGINKLLRVGHNLEKRAEAGE